MKVAHSTEGGREGHSPKPDQTPGREGPGRWGAIRPRHNTTSRGGASALRLPPSLPCIPGQAGQGLWELRGSCSPGAGRWACQGPGKVPDTQEGRITSQLLERTPGRASAKRATHMPLQGEEGSLCLSDLSPAPLDICQLGSSVLMVIMCLEASLGKTGTVPSPPRKF